MFGIPITSWEKLVSEFAQELDMSNFESRPYVDLTGQDTGTHVNLDYGDPTREEGLNGHEKWAAMTVKERCAYRNALKAAKEG